VCRPFILTISSSPLNVASASGVPPYRSTATSQFSIRASKVKSPCHIPMVASQLTDELSPGAPSIGCLQVLFQCHSITASKCISKLAQSRLRSASPNSLNHSLQMHLQTRSITASKCISEFTQSPSPSASQTRSIKYILKEQRRLSGDTGVTEVDRVAGSMYSADRSQS